MKKISAFLLVLILCFSMFAVTAFAAGDPVITVSSETAAKGEEVTVTVSLANNPGVAMLELGINYDTTRLEKVSFSGVGMDGGVWTVNKNAIWDNDSNSTYNGQILTLKFKVLDNAPVGDAPVSITVKTAVNWDLQRISISSVAGKVTVTVPAHDHTYGDWTVTQEATCTEAGSKTHTCTVADCVETETETITALGHSYGEWTETTAPSCTEKGVETRTCSACGATETRDVAAKGHSYGEWTETTAPTCTEKGVETRTCTCGATETRDVAAKGHSYGEWTETTAPSCTEKGVETRTCSACGETETRDVAAAGHSSSDWTVTKEPTCTEEGLKTGNCSVCGESNATEVIPALGHTVGKWINDAENHWHVCSVCEEKVDAAAHTFDWIVDKKATAAEDGLKHEECSACGYAKAGVTIPATGEELDDVPQTGDLNADPAMFILVMFCAAAAAAFVFKRKLAK